MALSACSDRRKAGDSNAETPDPIDVVDINLFLSFFPLFSLHFLNSSSLYYQLNLNKQSQGRSLSITNNGTHPHHHPNPPGDTLTTNQRSLRSLRHRHLLSSPPRSQPSPSKHYKPRTSQPHPSARKPKLRSKIQPHLPPPRQLHQQTPQ